MDTNWLSIDLINNLEVKVNLIVFSHYFRKSNIVSID